MNGNNNAEYKGPKVIPTVDVVAFNKLGNTFLIIRKPNESLCRFVGGHADVNSNSYEEDATRELMEETGVAANNLKYIGSTLINDPRYINSKDKIKTSFFIGDYIFGNAMPQDDVYGGETKWATVFGLRPELFMEEHRPLVTMLLQWIKYNIAQKS